MHLSKKSANCTMLALCLPYNNHKGFIKSDLTPTKMIAFDEEIIILLKNYFHKFQ